MPGAARSDAGLEAGADVRAGEPVQSQRGAPAELVGAGASAVDRGRSTRGNRARRPGPARTARSGDAGLVREKVFSAAEIDQALAQP
jgi:hypothetical protein